jgi:hypothetical protein
VLGQNNGTEHIYMGGVGWVTPGVCEIHLCSTLEGMVSGVNQAMPPQTLHFGQANAYQSWGACRSWGVALRVAGHANSN